MPVPAKKNCKIGKVYLTPAAKEAALTLFRKGHGMRLIAEKLGVKLKYARVAISDFEELEWAHMQLAEKRTNKVTVN